MPDIYQSKPFANLTRYTPISELIRELLPDIEDPPVDPSIQDKLSDFWRREAGIFATDCRPILFASGRLAVICGSPVWTTQLRNLVPSLTRQLNEAGFDVGTIDVKTRPESAPGIRSTPTYEPATIISPGNARALESLSRSVSHPGLRASLKKLSDRSRMGKDPEAGN